MAGYNVGKKGIAPGPPRPEPEAFSFRPQVSGELDEEYKTLKARARKRWDERGGRRNAIKGMVKEKVYGGEAAPGGSEDPSGL